MTQPELILKLIEQLMTEKEINIKLQLKLNELKNVKAKYIIYGQMRRLLRNFLIF